MDERALNLIQGQLSILSKEKKKGKQINKINIYVYIMYLQNMGVILENGKSFTTKARVIPKIKNKQGIYVCHVTAF